MNLIQYDQYTIQRKLYFFFLQNAALSGFVLSSPNLHFHSFSFFQLVGPIKPHNQTWTDMDKTKGVKKPKWRTAPMH